MDLKQFDTSVKSNEGVWSDIISPDGTTVLIKMKLAGRDSKILKKRQQELAKKRERKRKISAEEEDRDVLETAAVCTLDWADIKEDGKLVEGKILDDGKELPCTFENVKAVLDKYNWIAEQVIEIIAERSNFL